MSLPAFSVRNSVLVNMLMLVILAAGVVFAITLQREMFPESRPDKLLVSAVYPGVQPEDVEKAVTVKIEEAIRGLEGIETVDHAFFTTRNAISLKPQRTLNLKFKQRTRSAPNLKRRTRFKQHIDRNPLLKKHAT